MLHSQINSNFKISLFTNSNICSLTNILYFSVTDGVESAEDILKTRFAQMKLETEAFSSIKYVGLHTTNSTTDYEPLQNAIKKELNNTSVRSARKPHLVYNTLRVLNDQFSGEMENFTDILFPDQYFTCPVKCLSCGCRCSNSMGHLREDKPHSSNTRSVLQSFTIYSLINKYFKFLNLYVYVYMYIYIYFFY